MYSIKREQAVYFYWNFANEKITFSPNSLHPVNCLFRAPFHYNRPRERYLWLFSKCWAKLLFSKKECVQVFNIADITLKDPQNDSLAVYIIFSEDRTQAEVFAADLPENTILEAVKGGYLSKDSKIRLLKTDNHWKIRK